MNVKYLDLEEILRPPFQLIEDFGGSHGIRDEDSLKSVVEAPKQEICGQEQYPGIFNKAAVYLRNIAKDHPFYDDNKRTAITVCGLFLKRNGKGLMLKPIELEDFAIEAATKSLKVKDISNWLEVHSK